MWEYVSDVCEGANGRFCVGVFACGTCLFLQHLSLPQLSVTTLRLQKQQVLFFNIIDDVIHNFLLPSLNSAPVAGTSAAIAIRLLSCTSYFSSILTSVSQHSSRASRSLFHSSCFDTPSPAPLSPV